jgi:hypothetical protein
MSFQHALRALDGCSPAALRTFLSKGPGAARRVIGATLGAVSPKPRYRAIEFWDIVRAFPVDENLSIHAGSWTDGCTAPLERFLMAQLLRFFKPSTIVEVGTYRGTTTRLLLENASPDARVYTIDLPLGVDLEKLKASSDERLIQHRVVGAEYWSHPRASQVTQILGDTMTANTWEAVPEGVGFAFIDASHSYEAVRNDTERLRPKLQPEAVILWHDYSETVSAERGVGKYVRELMAAKDNVFICPETDLAFEVPRDALLKGLSQVPGWHPAGDYFRRRPQGPAPWLTK